MTENVAMKYEAWGWNVLSVDGHNINEIREGARCRELRDGASYAHHRPHGHGQRAPKAPPARASRTRFRPTGSRLRPPVPTSPLR